MTLHVPAFGFCFGEGTGGRREREGGGEREGGREGGGTHFTHSRSKTIAPRIPTMRGRSTSDFHGPGRHRVHQARRAMRCSAKGGGQVIDTRGGIDSSFPCSFYYL